MIGKLATSNLLVSQKENGAGPCMSINWFNKKCAMPPADLVVTYPGNNFDSYQASGTKVPILGTTRWAEFTGQLFPLRLEQRHPGRNAQKADVKALVKAFCSRAH